MTTPAFDQIDFVIITALEKEAQAVVKRLENHTVERFQVRDIRSYHCGTVPITGTEHAYKIAVVVLPSMGELSAANATTDALATWNPNFVLMVGIAGGIAQDDLDLGDVIVADQVVGYEYGKVKGNRIMPRDRVYPASALLLDRVRNFWDDAWAGQVNAPRPTPAGRDKSKRFVGPIASGNKVIASKLFQAQLKERWPKLIAVETEAEGVFAAVFDRPQIHGTLVIRGISDMADKAKNDAWQEYAANAAAAYTIAWLKSGPVDPLSLPLPKLREEGEPGRIERAVQVSLAKLPSTSPDLFGREKELALLDAAWNPHPNPPPSPTGEGKINVLTLVAWGGVGKSALVNQWLARMARQNYCGAERVFGWSFYSQGAAEGRQVSADPFIAAALKWFGDPDPSAGLPWDKGERLAELVKRQRTLLVLDGLEPLQNPPPIETGCIKDPGLKALLRELARQNPGLVVITTRLAVDDIKDFLSPLSAEGTGRAGVGAHSNSTWKTSPPRRARRTWRTWAWTGRTRNGRTRPEILAGMRWR
jgi:nucleoside phosphorylase